jgi:ureidoacrylate peracid hydrolase
MSPKLQPEWVAPRRAALLVIDLQVDFAAPEGAMARSGADMKPVRAALEKIALLVDAARKAEVPCIFTRAVTSAERQTAIEEEGRARHGEPAPTICLAGSHGVDFVEPRPREGELVITKQRYSIFPGTGLAERLKAHGVDTVIFCGLTTECCIQSSAWDAFERDFHILIAEDAVAAYEPALHQAALRSLELSGAILAPAADFAAAWK